MLIQQSGLTPLHMAALRGNENVVRLLLNFPSVQADAASAVNVSITKTNL